MIDIKKAKQVFADYVSTFDTDNDRIKLKLVHTYGVMEASGYLANQEGLGKEDTELALLIALLHDIGRFEQLKQYGTFDDAVMDHAKFGVQLLFEKGMIRSFLQEEQYDPIIQTAIGVHSLYQIPEGIAGRELLHAKIIRDADKLDNFRVKNVETIETILGVSAEELGREELSDIILQTILSCKQIKKEERKTLMDQWVSFLAFLFDLNLKGSFQYLRDHDYINRGIDRIPYGNPETKRRMEQVRTSCLNYLNSHCPEQ